jgi:competence transcription factor ComK
LSDTSQTCKTFNGTFWTKSELFLNKIRLLIVNNPAQRFRPQSSFAGQQAGKNSLVGMTLRPPFLFARLFFGGVYPAYSFAVVRDQKFFRRQRATK